MRAGELVLALRATGVTLAADGDLLRWRGPAGAVTPALRAELATHKPALLGWLAAASAPWPAACLASERRFGARHARLFPLLNGPVSTPDGAGVLAQVFADRAAVALLAEPGRLQRLPPELVRPGVRSRGRS